MTCQHTRLERITERTGCRGRSSTSAPRTKRVMDGCVSAEPRDTTSFVRKFSRRVVMHRASYSRKWRFLVYPQLVQLPFGYCTRFRLITAQVSFPSALLRSILPLPT